MGKVKLTLNHIDEKLKLTKDDTCNFVDATYFRKLMKSLWYLTFTRHDIIQNMLKFEIFGSREVMLKLNQDIVD